jgi:hypothetical protein
MDNDFGCNGLYSKILVYYTASTCIYQIAATSQGNAPVYNLLKEIEQRISHFILTQPFVVLVATECRIISQHLYSGWIILLGILLSLLML